MRSSTSSATRLRRLAGAAVFLGASLIGASFRANATPPCPTVEDLLLRADKITIDGAAQPVPDEDFDLQPRNDVESGVFIAYVYDPDTGMGRGLELRRAP